MNQARHSRRLIFLGLWSLIWLLNGDLGCSPLLPTEQTKKMESIASLENNQESQGNEKKATREQLFDTIPPEPLIGDASSDKKGQEFPPEPSLEPKIEPVHPDQKTKEPTNTEQSVPESIPERISDAISQDRSPTTPHCQLTAKPSDQYLSGVAYFGRNRYIKYVAGSLPIILSSPHGGALKPKEIKSRTYGVLGGDSYSLEYTYEVARRLYQLTGRLPHIITNRLHRSKLDANRSIKEASQGDTHSERAWRDFRDFILSSRKWVTEHCQRGHYFDLHTNAHKENWTEFGILLSAKDLAKTDSTIDTGTFFKHKSSWKALLTLPGVRFSDRLRGPRGLGTLLSKRGYKSIPSSKHPDPQGGDYFNGGYNAASYGSRSGGTIDGTQIESHLSMLSNTKRFKYAQALAESLLTFVEESYGFTLRKATPTPTHSRCVGAKTLTFQQGVIDFYDQTWGALAEFFGKLHCGTNIKLNGAQLYYRVQLQANKKYTFSLTADFPARMYLFGETCDVSEINKQCQRSGINGILAISGIEKVMTYQPKKSGWYRFAVGSRELHWIGRFRLKIR